MKRLLFISHMPYLWGGTSRSLLLLIRHLRKNFDITVEMDTRTGDLSDALDKEGIHYVRLHTRTALYFPSLMYQIIKGKYDLIYGNNFGCRCAIAFWAAQITRKPFIWHIREPLHEKFKCIRTLPYAKTFIANSQDTANRIKRFAPNSEVFTILNGVEVDDFCIEKRLARELVCDELKISPESIVIINIGRLCERKNQMDVLETAARLIPKFSQLEFLFIGHSLEPEYVTSLKKRASQIGIQAHIHLVGYKNNVATYLKGSDILLHTPEKEPQGRVILEAMAAKLPVVAYQVGGVGEVVLSGKTGFLNSFGDLEGIAHSIEKLILNPSLRKSMGERGYQWIVEAFTAEQTAQHVKQVIESKLL